MVLFLFLTHLGIGILLTLLFVARDAGVKFFRFNAGMAAILVAAAVFAAVQVMNAVIDPTTLVQGIVIKIIIVAVLVKGIKGALDMRAAHG